MKYGSICSGVGALDRAVEQVFGAEPAWHAEVDKDACRVLARHWPGVPNLGDLRKVNWLAVEHVDLVCGGPPCQPVSQAGKRLGEKDDRFLWPDVLDVVGRLRPRWVVFENPPGIRPWLGAIAYRLARLGYVGSWGLLGAADIGACHQRDRFFIVAALADTGSAGRGRDAGTALGQEEPGGRGRADLDHVFAGAGDGVPVADAYGRGFRASVAQDDAGQPDLARSSSDPPADANGTGRGRSDWGGAACCSTDDEGEWPELAGVAGLDQPFIARMPDGTTRDYGPALRRHAAVLGRPWPSPTIGRSLNGDFSEWMMMLPEGWLDGLANGAKKRLAGNAVVTPQAVAALSQLRERLVAQMGAGA